MQKTILEVLEEKLGLENILTEDKLKAGVQIALGTLGLYTEEAETLLMHHIKALTINGVVKSLKDCKHLLLKNIPSYFMIVTF